jgi:hypothetical protein
MGLDMFAFKTKQTVPTPETQGEDRVAEQIAYWRKHPNLHGWMEELWLSRGNKSEIEALGSNFNCVAVELTLDDLANLERDVMADNLPVTGGFMFGASRPEHYAEDMAFIAAARKAIAEGYKVYYDSWW